jgi:hypothetical protein
MRAIAAAFSGRATLTESASSFMREASRNGWCPASEIA